MNAGDGALIAAALVVVAVCVPVTLAARRRAAQAAASARRAARAADAARRHCDGLIELLADASPSARRVWLATREYRSPVIAASHRRLFQHHDRIDEGTT